MTSSDSQEIIESNECRESAASNDCQKNAASMINVSGYFSHVGECYALTEQISTTFPSNTSKTELTCFDVGHNYIAFGSSCGALFIFNRRLNRSDAPLRTNTDDLITCVKFFSDEYDLLAVGYSSGCLALLNFPSGRPGSTKRLGQNLSSDGHKTHAVSCIVWAEDGKKVFSADDAGTVIVTSVDFIHNIFQTTFVCLEHSYVMQLTHISGLLALCTVKRIAVIDEIFFNSVLEINQREQKATCIHMIVKPCGTELFVLQSNGFIIIYDISSGEKKRSFSVSEGMAQKLSTTDFSIQYRSYRLKSWLLTVHSQIFIVHFYNYIVLLNLEDHTTLTSFNVDTLFHNRTFKTSICVDPKLSCPTIYILGPDNRVFCLSSNEIPPYLTEAQKISRECISNSLLTSFQRTTKFLPSASKDAFWDGLKVAKGINVFSSLRNLSLPILNADLNCILQNNNRNSLCDQLDSDSEGNKSDIALSQNKHISKHFEQMKIQPSNIIDNMNRVARTLVDKLGGFGTQVEDGFPEQSISDADIMDVGRTSFPVEQAGILQEIIVRRTKTVPINKRKKAEKGENIDAHSLTDSSKEDLSPVDECTLKNIRGALTIPVQIAKGNSQPQSDSHSGNIEQRVGSGKENEEVVCSDELNGSIDMKSESHDPVTEQCMAEDVTNLSIPELLEEGNAYEFLMKDALERKSFVLEQTRNSAICYQKDEQLIRDIVVMNNFSDIWNEIKLPYSCSSFSVSSQYLIICHSKKKKKPCYLVMPYYGTPQWMKLKQKADHFVVNDNGTLVWKILNNIAFAPMESGVGSDSFLTALHWTIVADEGGGVTEAALTTHSAWYITRSGEVFVQLCLPEMGILSRCETSWPLHCITASELAVWALQVQSGRLVVRTGLKYSPVGLDWVEVAPHGPTRLISICLYDQSGWAIDDKCSLWFTNGVGYQSPFGWSGSWMKVYNPWDFSPDINRLLTLPWVIRVSSAGVFVCVDHKCYWSSSTNILSGHRLEYVAQDKFSVDNNFELLAGGSLKEDFDYLTLCRTNEIFLYRLKNSYFYSLPAFPASFSSSIIEISSFDESIYVLDSSGCIYVKENISTVSPFGADWKLLDTGSCGAPVVSFTVTSVSLWVVTAISEACLYVKNEKKEPLIGTNPIWIHVKTLTGCTFDKIRASFNGMYIWIFSKNNGRACARSSITDVLPSGKSWIEASDEPGVYDLAVGNKIIWSLSASGQLHRLQGLAINNRAGNYWKPLPLYLKTITLDRNERLWGIDLKRRLVSHKKQTLNYETVSERQKEYCALSFLLVNRKCLEGVGIFKSILLSKAVSAIKAEFSLQMFRNVDHGEIEALSTCCLATVDMICLHK
ncbi:Tectonin beta-propeller repeat-containing protein [Dirofilaria immitis]